MCETGCRSEEYEVVVKILMAAVQGNSFGIFEKEEPEGIRCFVNPGDLIRWRVVRVEDSQSVVSTKSDKDRYSCDAGWTQGRSVSSRMRRVVLKRFDEQSGG